MTTVLTFAAIFAAPFAVGVLVGYAWARGSDTLAGIRAEREADSFYKRERLP